MKKCSRCGIEKPLSEFHKKPDSPDGLRTHCKLCRNEEYKVYMQNPDKKEMARKRAYRWRTTEKGKISSKERRRKYHETDIGKENGRKYSRIHRDKHPDRIKSRKALWWATASGKVIRPSNCNRCGTETKVHGHHHNGHNQEHWLDVIWLCRRCHTEIHRIAA
jgi:hypothetical protein